jgi:5,5'-dehydrodivanillate O-demethylase oxygenase subunit
MLTAEENVRLTRVGPGSPCGELLRRYWHPVAQATELTDESPTKFVRILGEDLVLFRDKRGAFGLLADHCAHRGASLLYGRVEERGISCAYHGWLYDMQGNCLETPAEPEGSLFHLTVKQQACPVREHYGLLWAYLGPAPAPELLRWDALELGLRPARMPSRFDCNWLQIMENHMDQSHVFILHQDTAQRGVDGLSTARGRIDALAELEYREVSVGIKRKQVHRNGYIDTDVMTFPNVQRVYDMFLINVPVDDAHTVRFMLIADVGLGDWWVGRDRTGSRPDRDAGQPPSTKTPEDAVHPFATYHMDGGTQAQDRMALETQGPIADRTIERLATSDRGIVMYREILEREIQRVERGLDPLGVVREPNPAPVDTDIQNWIEMTRRFPPARAIVR